MFKPIFALFWLMLTCLPAMAADAFVGLWEGRFTCDAQRNVQLRLIIKTASNSRLSGTFEYRGRRISFMMTGTVTSPDSFEFNPEAGARHPSGLQAQAFRGNLVKFGDREALQGRVLACRTSSFIAYRTEEPTPPPPVAAPRERDVGRLTSAVRTGIEFLVDRRDRNPHWWNRIEYSVIFSGVDRQTRDALLEDIREARANLLADALLNDLAHGPSEFPAGIGRALYVFRSARAQKWPDKVLQRVFRASEKRISDVLRPKLNEIASMSGNMPMNLDGLLKARAALNEVEAYRNSLRESFGVFDSENLLRPMLNRVALLEADMNVAKEFRAALDRILAAPNPRAETESLVMAISGYQALSEPLATIAKNGLRSASFAEVVIESADFTETVFEPKAKDIAWHVFNLVEHENARQGLKRCASGVIYDLIEWKNCALGEMGLKLRKIRKVECKEERSGLQYLCGFYQESIMISSRDGRPLQSGPVFEALMPNGRMNSSTSARFTRTAAGAGWAGSELGAR